MLRGMQRKQRITDCGSRKDKSSAAAPPSAAFLAWAALTIYYSLRYSRARLEFSFCTFQKKKQYHERQFFWLFDEFSDLEAFAKGIRRTLLGVLPILISWLDIFHDVFRTSYGHYSADVSGIGYKLSVVLYFLSKNLYHTNFVYYTVYYNHV